MKNILRELNALKNPVAESEKTGCFFLATPKGPGDQIKNLQKREKLTQRRATGSPLQLGRD
jgi:hypothetical protein